MGAHNLTEMLLLRGVLLTTLFSRIESEAALNPSLVEKKVHQHTVTESETREITVIGVGFRVREQP